MELNSRFMSFLITLTVLIRLIPVRELVFVLTALSTIAIKLIWRVNREDGMTLILLEEMDSSLRLLGRILVG